MKKCKNCGAPLEGFLYNTIGKLMGIKPSEKDQEICNKCEEESASVAPETKPAAETPAEKPSVEPEEKSPEMPEEKPNSNEQI